MLAAMERPKTTYRTAALSALGSALAHLKGNFFARVSPPLRKAIEAAQKTDDKVSSRFKNDCDSDRSLCRGFCLVDQSTSRNWA